MAILFTMKEQSTATAYAFYHNDWPKAYDKRLASSTVVYSTKCNRVRKRNKIYGRNTTTVRFNQS